MPENLKPERHIKELKKEVKMVKGGGKVRRTKNNRLQP